MKFMSSVTRRRTAVSLAFALLVILLFAETPALRASWTQNAIITSLSVLGAASLWALFWWRAERPNILPMESTVFDWSSTKAADSLLRMLSHCLATCTEATSWYGRAKTECQWWARRVRMMAIALVALAGVLPILSEIFKEHRLVPARSATSLPIAEIKPSPTGVAEPPPATVVQPSSTALVESPSVVAVEPFSPAWAAILLAAAGTFVLLDRFYGWSSAWIRYVTAATRLETLRASFLIEWEIERSKWCSQPPTCEQITAILQRAATFIDDVRKTIEAETTAWADEFKGALSDFDKKLRDDTEALRKELRERVDQAAKQVVAEQSASKPGSIDLQVVNGDKCDAGWTTRVDAVDHGITSGKTKSIGNVPPGLRSVRVTGRIAGQPAHAESTKAVRPNEITTVVVELVAAPPAPPVP